MGDAALNKTTANGIRRYALILLFIVLSLFAIDYVFLINNSPSISGQVLSYGRINFNKSNFSNVNYFKTVYVGNATETVQQKAPANATNIHAQKAPITGLESQVVKSLLNNTKAFSASESMLATGPPAYPDPVNFATNMNTNAANSEENEAYEKQGIAILFFNPPMPLLRKGTLDPNKATDNTQQNIIMNDCLYYMMGRARYIARIDMDELLVPANDSETVLELVQRLDPAGSAAAMCFQNRFFYSKFPDYTQYATADALPVQLQQLSDYLFHTVHLHKVDCSHSYQMKAVVQPVAVVRTAVHGIHEMFEEYQFNIKEKPVAVSEMRKFHMRKLAMNETFIPATVGGSYTACTMSNYEPKPSPLSRFKEKLLAAVEKRLGSFNFW